MSEDFNNRVRQWATRYGIPGRFEQVAEAYKAASEVHSPKCDVKESTADGSSLCAALEQAYTALQIAGQDIARLSIHTSREGFVISYWKERWDIVSKARDAVLAAHTQARACAVIERIALQESADPASDDLTIPLAFELVKLEQGIREALPDDYHPDLPLTERITRLVGDWRRLVEVNKQLEEERK